jgi:hypothetical protein
LESSSRARRRDLIGELPALRNPDLVQEYIEGQEKVDIVDLAARMAESLVELILLAPEEEHGQLLAATITHLGNAFLEKSGAIEGDSNMTH